MILAGRRRRNGSTRSRADNFPASRPRHRRLLSPVEPPATFRDVLSAHQAQPHVTPRRSHLRIPFPVVGLGALLHTLLPPLVAQAPGQAGASSRQRGATGACPAGTTEVRPGSCQVPELPPPSIVDYRPRSTLVSAVHLASAVKKYPAIDFHGHPAVPLDTDEGLRQLGASLDSVNVRLMVVANNLSATELQRTVTAVRSSTGMRDRVSVLAGIEFRNVGPGWAAQAVAQLESDVAAGAVGVGELSKGFGLSITKADGSRLHIDDPALDPVWQACARLRLPVFIHTADPQEFWQPIDYANERWLELALFPRRRYAPERFPGFEQLMTERE